jgi:phosphatidylglycerol lysyltransferase
MRLGLLVLAGWALRRELAGVQMDELLRQFGGYGWRHAALALAGTIASFLVLGLIEMLAIRHANTARIPRRIVLTTSFVANAFSQSIGLSLLTGAAVRLRAYERRGVDAAAVARISGFVTLTVTLGLVACGAMAFLASSGPLRVLRMTLPVHPLGVVLALVVAAYLAWSLFAVSDQVGRGRWRLRRPRPRAAVMQLLLSSADWLLTGTVLFAVLPSSAGVGYGALLRAYLVAQTAGMVSHVPGGAGVFEAVMLTLLTTGDAQQRTTLVAALVMFRAVYYLLPLLAALAMAVVAELRPKAVHPIALERELVHVE